MSQYRALSACGKEWVFLREEPFVSESDRAAIQLMSEQAGANIWRDYISGEHLYPELFASDMWVNTQVQTEVPWEARWESDNESLPEEVLEYCSQWGQDTRIYFCCHSDLVFETTWGVFERTWKAFLFLGADLILVGRKKKQALQFKETGFVSLLTR
ncbi:DUF2947 domain-containing protein [Marinomonas piezotolerans]|uniref:DUF2947 domain-containing protein n=1 Tax=Marinomonas piezotolerans TaxID=2213058 RepID=A0A370UD38_9GAMM|nr:DUF2947 family protein [Marinomonas piezotolerans]RDL45702.1 DUF2947 domain-containing protein [Marinomonas piezotolerans]